MDKPNNEDLNSLLNHKFNIKNTTHTKALIERYYWSQNEILSGVPDEAVADFEKYLAGTYPENIANDSDTDEDYCPCCGAPTDWYEHN